MADSASPYDIYLEVGQRKVFAVALRWPGWARFGKDEELALRALLEAAPRYARITRYAGLEFTVPDSDSAFNAVARLEGNATTDFGAPAVHLPNDWESLAAEELERYVKLLKGCWWAFDEAVDNAGGNELKKGPRGGGRDLPQIVNHVVEAEEGYVKTLGWKGRGEQKGTMEERKHRVRGEVISGLRAAAAGELPREGPRGGKRWPPRFFVRRLAWHAVDHAWEIEDRTI